jgi:hypothetical protein
MKQSVSNTTDVDRSNCSASRDACRFVQIGRQLVILGEVIQSAGRKNSELDSGAGNRLDSGSDRTVSAGDQNPLRTLFHFFGDRDLQLVGLNFMNVERARG